jgi:hypothetical protein
MQFSLYLKQLVDVRKSDVSQVLGVAPLRIWQHRLRVHKLAPCV